MRPPSTTHLVAALLALAGLGLTVALTGSGDLVKDPALAWRPVDPAEAPATPPAEAPAPPAE